MHCNLILNSSIRAFKCIRKDRKCQEMLLKSNLSNVSDSCEMPDERYVIDVLVFLLISIFLFLSVVNLKPNMFW